MEGGTPVARKKRWGTWGDAFGHSGLLTCFLGEGAPVSLPILRNETTIIKCI